ncbi:hypothetical protein HWV62_43004 [Athelia sp. TMB]|nr:hypothetical protein HWV62_43004 [Athelia sp. TMB]
MIPYKFIKLVDHNDKIDSYYVSKIGGKFFNIATDPTLAKLPPETYGESDTREVRATRCLFKEPQCSYVLVDTPGFDGKEHDGKTPEVVIGEWLNDLLRYEISNALQLLQRTHQMSRNPEILIKSVLLLHRIAQPDTNVHPRVLDGLLDACGAAFLSNVVLGVELFLAQDLTDLGWPILLAPSCKNALMWYDVPPRDDGTYEGREKKLRQSWSDWVQKKQKQLPMPGTGRVDIDDKSLITSTGENVPPPPRFDCDLSESPEGTPIKDPSPHELAWKIISECTAEHTAAQPKVLANLKNEQSLWETAVVAHFKRGVGWCLRTYAKGVQWSAQGVKTVLNWRPGWSKAWTSEGASSKQAKQIEASRASKTSSSDQSEHIKDSEASDKADSDRLHRGGSSQGIKAVFNWRAALVSKGVNSKQTKQNEASQASKAVDSDESDRIEGSEASDRAGSDRLHRAGSPQSSGPRYIMYVLLTVWTEVY